MSFALMILGGLLIDAVIGWPNRLYKRIGHPVTWMGRLIDGLEATQNRGGRRHRLVAGGIATGLVVGLVGILALLVQFALPDGWRGVVIGAVFAWPFIAARSLFTHVDAVAQPLVQGDDATARTAVAMIVGRDPNLLDTPGIARAAIESLAENASDGVTAPIFWGVVAGLPGIAVYKAINTLDSMIGHKNERYDAFGKLAARLDDVVNWIPSRLTGLLFALAHGKDAGSVLRTMARDAGKHRSPNAGWPESAMAATLGVRLSGPRVYDDRVADEPWLNADATDPVADDILKGLSLYRRAVTLGALALFVIALF